MYRKVFSPGRGDGVAEHGRGDALALVFGDDGDIDHFGRERPYQGSLAG